MTLYGLASARERLVELERELVALAAELEGGRGPLGELARFVAERSS